MNLSLDTIDYHCTSSIGEQEGGGGFCEALCISPVLSKLKINRYVGKVDNRVSILE